MTNEIFIAFEKSLKGEFVSANETKRRKGRKSCAQVWLNASNNGVRGGGKGEGRNRRTDRRRGRGKGRKSEEEGERAAASGPA